MKRVKISSLALGLLFVTGCQGQTNPAAPASSAESPPAAATGDSVPAESATAAAQNITLSVKSLDELKAWVADQKGKVVVVDYWSTSCGPCVNELPHFAALQKLHGDKVVCASFSLDYTGAKGGPSEKLQAQVLDVLQRLGVATTNFLSSDKDEAVTAAIDVAAIPAAMVYDRAGNMHKLFTNDQGAYGKGGYTYQKDVYPVVAELVGKAE